MSLGQGGDSISNQHHGRRARPSSPATDVATQDVEHVLDVVIRDVISDPLQCSTNMSSKD